MTALDRRFGSWSLTSTASIVTGLYRAGHEGLASFSSDIHHVCNLWSTACRRRGSRFVAEMGDGAGEAVEARMPALVAAAAEQLDAAEAGEAGPACSTRPIPHPKP